MGRTLCFSLRGKVPSKKNGKHSYRGRVVIDSEVRAMVDALLIQAQLAKNGGLPTVDAASNIHMKFSVQDGRSDLDGKYTTVQDVLVAAKILRNDTIKRVSRYSVEAEIHHGEEESVEITIEDSGRTLPIKERSNGSSRRSRTSGGHAAARGAG